MEIRKVRNEQGEEDIILCKISEKDIEGGIFVVPDIVTIIGEGACAGNLGICILDTRNVEEIRKDAFLDCTNLHSVQFGDKLEKVGPFALSNTAIRKVSIPKKTQIENFAVDRDVEIVRNKEEKTQEKPETDVTKNIFNDSERVV